MTHSEMDEAYELYLMGALDPEEAAEITEHINTNCDYCLDRIAAASNLLASLSALAEPVSPPPQLRERILSLATPAPIRKVRPGWPLAFALAAAASIALLVWGVSQQGALERITSQLSEVSRQRNELRSAIEILTQSDMRTVNFGQSQTVPHGRVFLSRNGGVVFLGSHLPEIDAGKTFELWLVPAKGNPQPAGLFKTNSEGVSVNVLAQSINPSEYAAVAVSVEPQGGSPQPSTKPILVVPLA